MMFELRSFCKGKTKFIILKNKVKKITESTLVVKLLNKILNKVEIRKGIVIKKNKTQNNRQPPPLPTSHTHSLRHQTIMIAIISE